MKTNLLNYLLRSSCDSKELAVMTRRMRFWNARSILALLVIVVLLGGTYSVQAAPIGPVYPAPGGTTFVDTGGVSGADALATWDYSAFNTSFFVNLYFGVDQITYGPLAAGLDGSLHPFSYVGAVGQTATWSVISPYVSAGGAGDPPSGYYPIEFRMTIADFGPNPWINATSVGLPAGIGSVVDNSTGSNFTLNWEMVANMGSGFVPLNSVPGPGGHAVSSFGEGFYYTIPEPATLVLAGLNLLGISLFRRRHM
jgi:hypothetical protein